MDIIENNLSSLEGYIKDLIPYKQLTLINFKTNFL